jgi:predicted nucleotidyltransferase
MPSLRENRRVIIAEPEVMAALRRARAKFAFVHGSRAVSGGGRAYSDLDVAAW